MSLLTLNNLIQHICIMAQQNWTSSLFSLFKVEDLFLTFAKKASAFNSWFENAEEDLTDPVRCNSLEEIKALREAHDAFRSSLSSAQADFNQLAELDRQIKSFRVASNPYTWFTMEALEETWRNLQKIIKASWRAASQSLWLSKSSLEFVHQMINTEVHHSTKSGNLSNFGSKGKHPLTCAVVQVFNDLSVLWSWITLVKYGGHFLSPQSFGF